MLADRSTDMYRHRDTQTDTRTDMLITILRQRSNLGGNSSMRFSTTVYVGTVSNQYRPSVARHVVLVTYLLIY